MNIFLQYRCGEGGGEIGACLRELIAFKNISPFTSIVVPIYLFLSKKYARARILHVCILQRTHSYNTWT